MTPDFNAGQSLPNFVTGNFGARLETSEAVMDSSRLFKEDNVPNSNRSYKEDLISIIFLHFSSFFFIFYAEVSDVSFF